MYEYSQIYREISYNVGIFIFIKKDNTVRVMLGTRNLDTLKIKFGWIADELSKMEKRCSISNGNLALVDMVIGQGRCFNMGRLVWYKNIGTVTNEEEYNKVLKDFVDFTNNYITFEPDLFAFGLSGIEELREKANEVIECNIKVEKALSEVKELDINASTVFNGSLII